MKTDSPAPSHFIDSPTLAVILALIAAGVVMVILAFNNPSEDVRFGQVSFGVAEQTAAPAAKQPVAAAKDGNLISAATPVQDSQTRGHPATTKESEEPGAADDSATGTAPDALH
jgi:hypothetical protein